MTQALKIRKNRLESQLSQVAKTQIEITFRSEKEFTFCWDGDSAAARAALENFFGSAAIFEDFVYDAECDASFLYMTLN